MIFRKILIPLILLGILLAATIYWKQEDSAGRGNPAGTFLHYSAGSKSRPAHTDSKPGPKTEMLKAENAQLRKQHQAMSAQLARTQSQLKRLQKAKQAQQDIRSQPETQQIASTMDLEVTRQDNHLVIYDKQGQELFGFDLENKRLSYEGGMHLFPLKTVYLMSQNRSAISNLSREKSELHSPLRIPVKMTCTFSGWTIRASPSITAP